MRELPDPRHPALAARGRHPVMRRLIRADPDDRWAAVFGCIAVYSFLVALVSGILLLPFFQPAMTPVVYHGSYRKLDGRGRPASGGPDPLLPFTGAALAGSVPRALPDQAAPAGQSRPGTQSP